MEDDPYTIGFPVEFHPCEARYRHMLHLVAYDVRNPKRLRRVAKVCEDFGIRVEYSVFECDLSDESFDRLWYELGTEIEPGEDTILAYRICGACVEKISALGRTVRPGRTLLYML